MALRVLIVTWAWPPIGRVGAMRPIGFAREWTAAGQEVHILTGPGDRGGEYAPDLVPEAEASGAHVHQALAPGIRPPDILRPAFDGRARAQVVRRPISRARQILGQWRGFPDAQRSWIGPAIARGRELAQEQRFDIVWTTSPPESVHYVGHALARDGMAWVADFRDQWSEYLLARWDPISRHLIDRITRRILQPAVAVTAATEGVTLSIARASGRTVVCVRNGFDPVPTPSATVRPRVLGYFGRVDPVAQHPERLWPALRQARDRGRPWMVEFYAAPGGGGGAHIAIPPDLIDLVAVHPPLPHPEALRRMQTSAALLVLAWEARRGETTVAAKLYEYVGSGRPVLVCAPARFEARRLVESTGTGLGAWTTEELVAALGRIEAFTIDRAGRATLSRDHAARQLLTMFEHCHNPASRT